MKHGKLIGLQTDAERLARVAVAAYDAATAPQTAPSGSISLDNADGTRTIIGPQAGSGDGAPSGQAIATHVGDTTPPPVPTGITAWSGDGSLHVAWDGTLSGDVPADFDHISILVDGREVAQLSSAGSVTIGGVEAGATVSVTATAEDDACLADGTPAHNVSVPCAAVAVEIRDVAEEVKEKADAHAGQIEAIQADIEAFKQSATATYATKTEVDEKTGAITKTLTADYTKTSDIAATYAEKTELNQAVNELSSTMTSNYSAFTDYRTSNDAAVSKAQTDAAKALEDIQSVKTDYATKSELSATDKELSGKISDTLTTVKAYTDSSISEEVTARNAAIKAQADSISLEVSRTYTRADTFAAYQDDADGRIAAASSDASTAKSTATAAQTMATENRSSIKQLSDSITSEVSARTETDRTVSDLSSRLTQTASGLSASISKMSETDEKVNAWFDFEADASGNPQLKMGSSTSPVVGTYTNSGLAYKSRDGATIMELDASRSATISDHMEAQDMKIGKWKWVQTQGGTHLTLVWAG